jgi:acyl-CoA dehydrogenase
MYHYIQHRKQFKIPIGNMEAIQEKFIQMFYHTFVINAGVHFIGHILDKKITPSVLTAIMKQQSTERARLVINLGMDIYAGSGICLGKNNFFSKLYQSAPIGITVEGSNTLTRSLIIFGQGLNKSHPHIYNIFKSIQEENEKDFSEHFSNMVNDALSIYVKSSLGMGGGRLERLTLRFSNVCNFIALLGGKIKSRQMISGYMADILSNIFLAHAVKWYFHHYLITKDNEVENFILDELCSEAEQKMNIVISNYPMNLLLLPCMSRIPSPNFKKIKNLYDVIHNEPCYLHDIKKDLYYTDTVIEKLERLSQLASDSEEYRQLYEEVIQVGEFPIES